MSERRRVLVERFEAAAARAPADIAVAHHGRTLTFAELNAAANRLAHMLLGPWGIASGEHVAIAADRGLELIVAVVGVLKAGAGYVPLDASYPPDRLTFMLEDSGARILLVSEALAGQFAGFPGRTVTLEAMISESAAQSSSDPDAAIDGRAPGYVIYTSGSTGKPKGVMMSRGALDNLVDWQLRHTSVLAGGRTVQFSPLSFDVSFQEIASTLAAGGTLVLIDEVERLDSLRLLTFLREQRIDRLFLPFVALQALSEQGAQAAEVPGTLKEVVTAGEQLQVTRSLVRFFERIAPATLHNHYGPSETHVVTSFQLTGPPASWPRLPPIGAPIDGVRAYLADPEGHLVPDGEEGELYFGGVALADGYLGRPELTAERFLKNPFRTAGAGPGDDEGPGMDRVYRTGDLGRRLPDGNLEFLGRRDGQVKIRGFRVELGEIEVALDAHPGVAQVAVTARDDASGEGGPKRLVAYVVRKADQTTNASALRRHLSERVPDYMLPSAFVFLQALPTTASGKIDRRALPAPTRARPELDQPYREPRTPIEREICALWSELLDIEPVGARDDFFDLGGTSLVAMRFASELLRRTGRELPVVLLFEHSTPAALAETLERGSAADDYVASARARQRRASAGAAEAIAIVGMAGRFPDAVDVEALWRNLCEGREGVRFFAPDELDASIPRELREDPAYVAARGVLDEVAGFDAPLFGIGPREADVIDPQQRILLELAWHALEDAGCDPARVEGQVGVWAGVMNNTYFSENLRRRPDIIEAVGAFSVMTGNEKDYAATRISHRLNLTGPSVSVHTACSTSLVAVHMAAQSLRAFECDVALAGGACITVPSASGYVYNEGGMLSADGHCRSFDAAATGTTFSDGAGMVVLRRLADAVRDGDRVYAVIRGSAINNDGAAKASFTAPSVEGQARAIAAAVAAADVPSDSIGYVETHGTATPLGDPIEVAALLRVYGRSSSGPTCGLGSIKSNFGHLTAAAGVTGLIKATLAVERAQIPPTLHFRSPNPAIDFGGRFFVVDQLRDWPDGPTPRRAAISSMGVGGTNAHAIIEQAPPAPPEETSRASSRPSEVLWMSARTDGALDALGRSLADHLERHPHVPLGDVAFTLAHGRRPLGRRRALVARDHAALIAALRTGKGDVQTGAVPAEVPEVAFVFPGQGTQYPGMARGLFDSEPTFRAALQQCALVLDGQLAVPLLDLLYPATADEAAAERLRETQHAQPALFAVEYALAQLFLSWGIRPAAMVGHSVGEFVAATLAGVFTLSDALRLVAARGRLMQQMPPGAMLSVRAPADTLASRLVPGTEIAAINGRSLCVVAGPVDAVAALEARLAAEEVPCKRLRTSHAFHTAMMEPVIAPFTELVRQIQLSPPRIPFVSTATGRWIGDGEATDPAYWARHLRAPVQFAPALQTLCEGRGGIVLELGPSGTLPALLRQSLEAGKASDLRVVTALGPVSDATGEQVALMHAVGALWTAGLGVDTRAFWMHERRRKVPLPLYPFERQRHWVDAPSDADVAPALPVAAPRAAPGAPRVPSATNPIPLQPVENRDIAAPAVGTPSAVPHPVPRPEVVMSNETHRSRVVQQVRALLEQASGLDLSTFDENVTFPEMGVDSLLMTQAALTFKKKFGVPVSFRQLNENLSSMGALADYLAPHVAMEAPPPEAPPAAIAAAAVGAGAAAVVTRPLAAVPSLAASGSLPRDLGSAAGGGVPESIRMLMEQQLIVMTRQIDLLANTAGGGASAVAPAVAASLAPAAPPSVSHARPEPREDRTAASSNGSSSASAATAPVTQPPKAFGAQTKIDRARRDLDANVKAKLDLFIKSYVERTSSSKAYTARHRPHFADPRVVSGFRPALKEITYPIVVERSKGARLWDIDGNEYVDLACGFGSNFLGHSPDFVNDAVKAQIDRGVEIGPQHPLAGEVAALIAELSGMERVALCNTGSEAVLGATRLARTVTGNMLIVMFNGAYHGIFDEVIVRGTPSGKSYPAASGIPPEAVANTLILDYGTDEALRVIRERADDLAAVMVEPVQSRRPDFQPAAFLRELRTVTERAGCALIFDEVITGFRIGPGGAQAHFNVRADLATYGKIIGGGMPIGAIAGAPRFMDALDGGMWRYGDDSIPEVGVTYFAGTFVRHPVALAAAKAALGFLKERGPELQRNVNQRTERLVRELNEHFDRVGAPVHIPHFGSLFKPHVDEDLPFGSLFFHALRRRGVHIWEGRPCFLTVAHDDEDVAFLSRAFRDATAEMQQSGFFPTKSATQAATTNATTSATTNDRREAITPASGAQATSAGNDAPTAPVPGARLGKDPDGKPAWFAPDPDRPGKYVRIGAA